MWLNGDVITYTGGCKHVTGFRWPSLEPVWHEPEPKKEKPHSSYEMYD